MFDTNGLFGTRCVGCACRGPLLCGDCLRSTSAAGLVRRPAHVSRLLCAWAYEGSARSLILRLKVRGIEAAADPLVAAMAAEVHRSGLAAIAVTWVPGRPADVRRRGFDHAEVLARGLSLHLGLPCVDVLERRGRQADQAGLDARARAANLRGAFEATRCPAEVALVDDVVTTGSTLASCAAALRRAGAVKVEAVVAAAA